ncbi:hypothetical protein HRE53_30865 (plasmid) [Acaryochloris sp. 'Moss Beach']|uniref:hypothetical protein n=1 Tax=Acaryochloris sp. 'Moss Beach' TaxID=2740837 RepID=UPI001F2FF367|nr:hypothetical protein [Acaryochloris sp. 'Moss Beach']UJB73117.1 hypothetical protein HRE53_30865 [Acaryochloris sp. 'Moss Beach']
MKVHRDSCIHISEINPERKISLNWNCDKCRVQILIRLNDCPDVMRTILNALKIDSMIPDLRSFNVSPDGTSVASIMVVVTSGQNLNKIMKEIREMPRVITAKVKKIVPFLDEPKKDSNCKPMINIQLLSTGSR